MERPAGLGRSLEDVLDSLTPVEQDATALGRVLFEPDALEQQLDQLMGDLAALRDRVQHLVGLVPDDAVVRAVPEHEATKKKKKKKTKKTKGKKDEKG
jgi:hypothetical protein